jgi:hypothetical protein
MATVIVTHSKIYTKPTGTDPSIIYGPDWNGNHVVTGLENVPNVDTTNASNITSGTLPAAQMPALTGDVTTIAGAVATTIATNAVTNAKAARMAANTIKGNNTGGTANAADLTGAQVEQFLLFTQAGTGAVQRLLDTKVKESVSVLDFGAVADGVISGGVVSGTDNTAAFQAAINAVSTNGGVIIVPPGKYAIGPLAGASNVVFNGLGHLPGFGAGAMLLNNQTGAGTGPMFSFPAQSAGWGFFEILIDGNNILQPAIKTVDAAGVFGSFDFHINRVTFQNCHPAIYGIGCFDAWVINCVFRNNGNMASGVGAQTATIYLQVSAITGNGNNTWHITNNFIETLTGRGVLATGAASASGNQGLFIANNHFEGLYPTGGYEHIFFDGTYSSLVTSNFMLGTSPSTPLISIGVGSRGNVVANNSISGAGFYSGSPVLFNQIVANGQGDIISNNSFTPGSGAPANVSLGATSTNVTVTGNKSVPVSVQSAADSGTDNSIYGNDNDFLTAYTPTIAFTGGTGVTAAGLVCGFSREGSRIFISVRFQVTFTIAPTQITFTLPNSKTVGDFASCGGFNVSNTKAITAFAAAGANTLSIVYAAGGVGVTTSGDVLSVSGYLQI